MTPLCQVAVSIDSIVLDGVVEVKENDLLISDFGNGPVVTMSISITNRFRDELIMSQHGDYELYCEFEYNGLVHKSLDFYLSINEDGNLSVPHDSTYRETVSAALFLPYNIVVMDDVTIYDHTQKLQEVLSSLRLIFIINNVKYVSDKKPVILMGRKFLDENKWSNY